MNKKLLLSIMFLLFATYISVYAQSISKQVIGSSGALITSETHKINFTVGETIVGLIENDAVIHQGFWASISEQSTLSLENPTVLSEEITVFPNPANNFIKIKCKTNSAESIQTQLYDITGKEIYNTKSENNGNQTTIDISQLSQGMYLLVLSEQASNYKKTFKIIKQ